MAISGSVVFYKIASVCLLIFVGFIARRMKLVPENSPAALSYIILDIATPCYILTYMPRTVSRESLATDWLFLVLAFLLVGFSDLIGLVSARFWAGPGERTTFRFLVAIPNWMFLAMAVCEPLFGHAGVRVVLLFNFSITVYIWTLGMTGFQRGTGASVWKQLFLNKQIVATVLAVAVSMAFPFAARAHEMTTRQLAELPLHLGLATVVWEAITLLGSTALPLSLFLIGLRLGGPAGAAAGGGKPGSRSLFAASLARLFVVPASCLAVQFAACRLGMRMTEAEFVAAAVIMSMPTAVLSLTVAEVYGGATLLAARGILWMTVASMATAPALTRLAQFVYGAI